MTHPGKRSQLPTTQTRFESSLFHRFPLEITDTIFDMVGEGLIASGCERITIPATVYDSLSSFETYLCKQGVNCTRFDGRTFCRRYRRRPHYFHIRRCPNKTNSAFLFVYTLPTPPAIDFARRVLEPKCADDDCLQELFAYTAALCQILPYIHPDSSKKVDIPCDVTEMNTRGVKYYETVLSQKDVGILDVWRKLIGTQFSGKFVTRRVYKPAALFRTTAMELDIERVKSAQEHLQIELKKLELGFLDDLK